MKTLASKEFAHLQGTSRKMDHYKSYNKWRSKAVSKKTKFYSLINITKKMLTIYFTKDGNEHNNELKYSLKPSNR
jgi:hypothetical protein